jgi:1-acyl-sn-glycerol-3-phosphate acyltransferase
MSEQSIPQPQKNTRPQEKPEPASATKRTLDKVVVHHLLARLLRLLFRVYGRWKVVGRENLPRTGPVLIAGNHASYIDPLLGFAALYGTRRAWGVARDDLWRHPVVAYLLDSIGVFPVKRNSADRTLIRRVLEKLEEGDMVALFPEGTRTEDGELNPAQPGIALLVQKSGAPVVPVALLGTYEMLPKHQKSLRRVPLTIAFGEPIHFPADATREQITTRIMAEIAALMTANGRPTLPPSSDRRPAAREE